MGLQLFEIILVVCAIVFLFFSELFNIQRLVERLPFIFRFAYYYILVVIILGIGVFSGGGEFIYFQF